MYYIHVPKTREVVMISLLLLFAFVMSSGINLIEKRIDHYSREQAANKEPKPVETKVRQPE